MFRGNKRQKCVSNIVVSLPVVVGLYLIHRLGGPDWVALLDVIAMCFCLFWSLRYWHLVGKRRK